MTSYNPNDIREKYCGNCHGFHDTMNVRTERARNVIGTPVELAVAHHDSLVSLLRTLTPTLSQSSGTVYIDFGGDAENANIFLDVLMEMVD